MVWIAATRAATVGSCRAAVSNDRAHDALPGTRDCAASRRGPQRRRRTRIGWGGERRATAHVKQGRTKLERNPPLTTGIVGLTAHFAPGEILYWQGDRGTDVFKVLSGLVMTGRNVGKGRRIYAFHGRGDAFGFDVCGIRSLFAVAVSKCTVATYHRHSRGRHAGGSYPGPLLSQTLRSIARTRRHAMVLRRRSALAWVAAFLVEELERAEVASVVELPMSRRDLASYLGLAARSVSSTLLRLRRTAVIEMPTRRQVRVLDPRELHRLDA
jgi:CRP-like cAMP-binding protein